MTSANKPKRKSRARTTSEPALSPMKKRFFTALLILLPILLLLGMELTLRAVNYGGTLDLFISGPGRLSSHVICNPNVARRYFVAQKQIPAPPNDYFLKHKPANGFRVFVLGASTTYGYPFGYNLMFSRMLEHRLNETLPNRRVEVVNVAMPAINSYSLLDFMDEILKQAPDVILIYAGHNEYYGALGAASMVNMGRARPVVLAYMQLTRLKLFLAVRDVVSAVGRGGAPANVAPTATLMERMVSEQSIPLNSKLYHTGVQQYEQNMRAILKKAQRYNVSVLLSDLVCNVSDLKPFVSLDGPESAASMFEQAQQLQSAGQVDEAKLAFETARDLDALRFRAPSALNTIVHQLGSEFQVPVVAMQAAFESASPQGLVGDNLMLDHVHPTIEGYFLMSDAFYATMQNAGVIPPAPEVSLSTTELQRQWHYTALDSLYGELGIRILKGGWPFRPRAASNTALDDFQPQTVVEEMAKRVAKYDNISIAEGHELLAQQYETSGELHHAREEYKALVAFKPFSAVPYLKLSELLIKADQVEAVPDLVQRSLRFDESPLAFILLGEASNALGRYPEAIEAFQHAQQLGAASNDPHILVGLQYAYRATGQLEKARELQARLASHGDVPQKRQPASEVEPLLERADQLIRQQRYEQALQELETSLSIQETGKAHMWIGQIYLQQKQFAKAVTHLQTARQMRPEDPLLLYNLSIALVQQQQYQRAWEVLETLRRVAPDFADPYKLREQLEPMVRP